MIKQKNLNAKLETQFKITEGILKDLTPSEKTLAKLGKEIKEGNPNFSEPATTDETADGLYSLEDDYGTSYYYRGNVEDNYVKFAGFYWRIVRVNGDGSVRLLYDGTEAHINSDTSEDRVAWTSQPFNAIYDDAKYVGYMFGGNQGVASSKRINLGEDGYTDLANAIYNQTSSDIKLKLEKWYVDNLKSNDEYIADTIYCNDRSTPGKELTGWNDDTGLGYAKNKTAYGSYMRSAVQATNSGKYTPQFTCANKNDAFTVNETGKENGALSEKVGLVTMDEAWAGGTGDYQHTTINTSNYLYKENWYWTNSPYYRSTSYANLFCINKGYLSNPSVDSTGSIAPVISLTPEYVNTLIGDGTMSNPFRAADVEP